MILVVVAIAALPFATSIYARKSEEWKRTELIKFIDYCKQNEGLRQIDPNKDYSRSSLHDLKTLTRFYLEQSCFDDVTDYDDIVEIDKIVGEDKGGRAAHTQPTTEK